MSEDNKSRSFSESLVLDDSENGVIITGITDDTIAAKSGLQTGDEIVAATIHLDHLNKSDVLKILRVLEPYDNKMKVLTKKDLSASAGLGSFGLDLEDPAEMLSPKKVLSLDASAEAPVASLDGQIGKLNAADGPEIEISGPALNGDLPNVSLNKPLADVGANFTTPSLGLTGPDTKGDLELPLKSSDISLVTPEFNTPTASLNVETPEMETGNSKYKTPKFTMPHFKLPQLKTPKTEMDVSGDIDLPSVNGNLETPDLNLSASGLDLKSPEFDLNGPKVDLNDPDVNLEIPNANIEAPSGKTKFFKWKGPKVKGPDASLNADLSAPDASLPTPKIVGDLSAPDINTNFPKADIKGPDLDIQTPNLDSDIPVSRINWPHLKWQKPKLSGPKADLDLDSNLNTTVSVPKFEGGLNDQGVDINLPKADLTGPDLDMQTPNIDVEAPTGTFTWPHQRWKKFKGPNADLDIDADLNTPNLNISTPKIKGDIDVPNAQLNLPKADLQCPSADIQAPDIDIDPSPRKIKWPHHKWKKPKLHGPKADVDLNGDLGKPSVDLSVPKIDGEINTPDVDINLPKAGVDVKALEGDIEVPPVKARFPTLKKPKLLLSGPKVKSPDVDLDADVKVPDLSLSPQGLLNGPEVDLNLPKTDVDIKAKDVDIDHPSGKFKWPTLRKPKWSVAGPKVNGPDVDLNADISAADLNISAPNIDGEITAPDAPDLKDPNLDINAPDVEGPSGILKWFNFKKSKFGTLKGPKTDIDADLMVPNVDLKAQDLSAPDLNLSAPKIEGGIEPPDVNISMPNLDVKDPNVDISGPDLDLDTHDSKLNLPKFKLPKLGGPKVKGPQLDADLKAPDIDVSPNVDLKTPDLSLSASNIDVPDLDSDLGTADLKGPSVDFQPPEADVSAGKFKLPKMKLPKFGLSGPRVKGPNHSIDADLSTPTITGDVSTPDLDVDAHLIKDIDLDLPKADLQETDLKLKAPDLSMSSPEMNGTIPASNIGIKLPKVETDAPDATMTAPNADINLPTADAKLKTPDLDFDSHLGDFRMPHLNLPKLSLSSTQAEVPSVQSEIEAANVNIGTPTADTNISVPAVDLTVPKAEGDITGHKIDVTTPDVDANLEKSKFPHFKLPKLNFSGSNIKSPDADASSNQVLPDLKVKAPSVEEDASSALVSASAPEVKASINTPELDIIADADAEVKGSPKSKLKWPFKWGFKSGSSTDEEESGVNSETDVSNTEVEVPAFKFHRLPKNSIDGIGAIGDTFGLTKIDKEAKDYVVSKGIRLPIVSTTSKAGEKIDLIERLKMAKEKAPSANVSPTEAKTDINLKLGAPSLDVSTSTEAQDSSLVRGGTFKVEKQESMLGLIAPEILTSDENDKLSTSLSNMLGLNIKDSDAE